MRFNTGPLEEGKHEIGKILETTRKQKLIVHVYDIEDKKKWKDRKFALREWHLEFKFSEGVQTQVIT